ncbi:hypothetical protein CPB83DRAFT_71049 [Crepidotus variabilis]|uniref:Uncharacterized protein n=1 Tax=Crepidotus variabilis TaxID=179855 RepID=A0A9P6E5F6_9AGAR|nr:hypothetical protein CPB83DRAFT_71049 [Crepidotus variabilis]
MGDGLGRPFPLVNVSTRTISHLCPSYCNSNQDARYTYAFSEFELATAISSYTPHLPIMIKVDDVERSPPIFNYVFWMGQYRPRCKGRGSSRRKTRHCICATRLTLYSTMLYRTKSNLVLDTFAEINEKTEVTSVSSRQLSRPDDRKISHGRLLWRSSLRYVGFQQLEQ